MGESINSVNGAADAGVTGQIRIDS
jgi:hypothetical protein